MKNSIRRLISFAIALILLILTTSVLSGCYVIRSGRMHKIEGTYALTSYGGDVDRLAENGIQMFLVIREDGTGHYAYLDNDTEPYITDIKCRFINDTEDPDKYSYVEIDFGNGEYEKFGVFAQTFKLGTTLTCHEYVYDGNIFEGTYGLKYTISATFTKVSRSTDLDHVNDNFSAVATLPFKAKKYDGTYRLETAIKSDGTTYTVTDPEYPFVYRYVTFDLIKGTAKIYEMKKSDEQARTTELSGLTVTSDNGDYIISDGGANVFRINTTNSTLAYSLDVEQSFGNDHFTLRSHHYSDMTEEQIAEFINTDINGYLASKNTEE